MQQPPEQWLRWQLTRRGGLLWHETCATCAHRDPAEDEDNADGWGGCLEPMAPHQLTRDDQACSLYHAKDKPVALPAAIEAVHDAVRAEHGPVPHAELLARAIADDPAALKARFDITLDVFVPDLRKRFQRPQFDFEAKALIGDDGLALVYKIRPNPDQPIAYRNQQTSLGIVVLGVAAKDGEPCAP